MVNGAVEVRVVSIDENELQACEACLRTDCWCRTCGAPCSEECAPECDCASCEARVDPHHGWS